MGADFVPVYDYVVKNRNSGKCLAVVAASLDEGAPVEQQDCVGGNNQIWRMTNGVNNLPNSARYLWNLNSGFAVALDIAGS